MSIFEPDAQTLLATGMVLGASKAIEFNEVSAGRAMRSQEPSNGWIELPAQLETTGAYGHLGYHESTAARDIGWGVDRRGLHSVEFYRVNLATFCEVGFVFNWEDVHNYIAWLEFDNWFWPVRERLDKWRKENGCYYMDASKNGEPLYERGMAMGKSVHMAHRWAEKFYLRGQMSSLAFVRGKLPPGWTMEDEGHHYGYWTKIVKPNGEEGGSVFYKAHESCHMRLSYEHDDDGNLIRLA